MFVGRTKRHVPRLHAEQPSSQAFGRVTLPPPSLTLGREVNDTGRSAFACLPSRAQLGHDDHDELVLAVPGRAQHGLA